MIKIISPEQFKTIAWKNGQGQTTELAISPNGTLNDFDWRLSIASVVENGGFSDFSGYDRQLILLHGNGIKLTHDEVHVNELKKPLAVAAFDGASHTVGELLMGPIEDFNVMTKQGSFEAEVKTFPVLQSMTGSTTLMNFIYAAKQPIKCHVAKQEIDLPVGHLLQITTETSQDFTVSGEGFIVILIQTLAERSRSASV